LVRKRDSLDVANEMSGCVVIAASKKHLSLILIDVVVRGSVSVQFQLFTSQESEMESNSLVFTKARLAILSIYLRADLAIGASCFGP
jgi:hypothetical protein